MSHRKRLRSLLLAALLSALAPALSACMSFDSMFGHRSGQPELPDVKQTCHGCN